MAIKMKNLIGVFSQKRTVEKTYEVLVSNGGKTEIDESFNKLKDNILYLSDSGIKVYQFESSISGEGKTSVVCNLGVTLSFNEKKVVIVDFDFNDPAVVKAFNVEASKGISDYVYGGAKFEDIIIKTEIGVDVITRGNGSVNASFVLNSEKIKSLIEKLKEEYDFVLLDCPPVLSTTDYMNVARYSDGVMLVVSSNFVKKKAVKESIRLLSKIDAKIIGAIMTMATADQLKIKV